MSMQTTPAQSRCHGFLLNENSHVQELDYSVKTLRLAREEAEFLNGVEKQLPKDDQQAMEMINVQVQDMSSRYFFNQDHKAGKTARVLQKNIAKLADAAERKYHTGFFGWFKRILSSFNIGEKAQEIQKLREFAAREIKQI